MPAFYLNKLYLATIYEDILSICSHVNRTNEESIGCIVTFWKHEGIVLHFCITNKR